MTEKDLQNDILSYLHLCGIFCWQNDSVGIYDPRKGVFRSPRGKFKIKGVSDILGIFQGRPLAIEVKTKTGRMSPEQKTFLARFEENGGIAFIARSTDDVRKNLFPETDSA